MLICQVKPKMSNSSQQLNSMLFSLSHARKKKATERKKKKPEGHDTVKTPSMCYQRRCNQATMAVLAYLGLTAGPKLLRDRRSLTRGLPPESMSWFMLMLLRYCEDSVPLQTTVYLPVLNFSGGYGRSVHTNEDGFVCRRVGFFLLFFFPPFLLIKSGTLESQNYLYRACRKHAQAWVVLS